jgi:hypothetical protein
MNGWVGGWMGGRKEKKLMDGLMERWWKGGIEGRCRNKEIIFYPSIEVFNDYVTENMFHGRNNIE